MSSWTPQLVEDLVARQFIHNQDVSALRPPAPLGARNVNVQQGAATKGHNASIVPFSDATKQYMKFFNQQNVPPVVGSGSPAPTTTTSTPQPQPLTSPSAAKAALNTASPRFQQQPQVYNNPPSSRSLSPQTKPLGETNPPQHQQQQMFPSNNAMSAMMLQQQAPQRPDCVSACKNISANIQFPAHIPKNSDLMTKPDPNDPKKSLCPSSQLTIQRILAQQRVDPDLIFAQPPKEFPLKEIFAAHPSALETIEKSRGESGDWRSDTFSRAEEAMYKREMGYDVIGPYQAYTNNFGGI